MQTCKTGLIHFHIDALYDLISDVCNGYHNGNPYHNFRHAIDVMQSTWYFLCSIKAVHAAEFSETYISTTEQGNKVTSLLGPIDILGLLMASLGHDVGHPGVNNGFMVKKKGHFKVIVCL